MKDIEDIPSGNFSINIFSVCKKFRASLILMLKFKICVNLETINLIKFVYVWVLIYSHSISICILQSSKSTAINCSTASRMDQV